MTGLHSGTLQVFVRKHAAHGAALWGRNGGHGWRQTHITLRGADIKSVSRPARQAEPGRLSFQRRTRGSAVEASSALPEFRHEAVAFPGPGDPASCLLSLTRAPSYLFFTAASDHRLSPDPGEQPLLVTKKNLGVAKVKKKLKLQKVGGAVGLTCFSFSSNSLYIKL